MENIQEAPIFSLPPEIIRMILSIISNNFGISDYFFMLTCKFYYNMFKVQIPFTPIDFFLSKFNLHQYSYQIELIHRNKNLIYKSILGLLNNRKLILSGNISQLSSLCGFYRDCYDIDSFIAISARSSWKRFAPVWKISFTMEQKKQITSAFCHGLLEARKKSEESFELENTMIWADWIHHPKPIILNMWFYLIEISNISQHLNVPIIAASAGCKMLCIANKIEQRYLVEMTIKASTSGHLHICVWICNVTIKFGGGITPDRLQQIKNEMLLNAAKGNHIEICRFAKQWGANKSKMFIGNIAASHGYTELFRFIKDWGFGFGFEDELSNMMESAARNEHLEICEEILNNTALSEIERQELVNLMLVNGAWHDGNSIKICRHALLKGANDFTGLLSYSAKLFNIEGCKLAKELGAKNFEVMIQPKFYISGRKNSYELQQSLAATWIRERDEQKLSSSNGGTKRPRNEIE